MSFEVDGERLHISLDRDGLDRLRRIVELLIQGADRGVNEDAHLFAKSWGVDDLNESPTIVGAKLMKQVDIRVVL
jgi:hypothetical protein